MAIHRGLQSAIFYYLSCAPCAESRYRKKRKQEAARSRAERELLQEEHPNLYRHPSPSSTNPHWQSEIALGPTLVSRGKRKTTTGDSQRGGRVGRVSSNTSGNPSVADVSSGNRNGSLKNFRSYQRDDEELWGSSSQLDGSAYAESLTRPQRVRTRDGPSDYKTYRNPPISDLHPATFRKVHNREEVAWMMQPPPVAEVMNGKQRAPRSRSDSGGSCLSPTSSTMSRQVSNRLHIATPMSRESSSRTSNAGAIPRQGSTTTSEKDFAISPGLAAQNGLLRQPSPVTTLDDSEDSSATIIRRHSLAPEPLRRPPAKRVASRPQLSTIASDNTIPADRSRHYEMSSGNDTTRGTQSSEDSSIYADQYTRRRTILFSEQSFKAMPDAGPRVMRGKVFRTTTDVPDTSRRMTGHKHEDSEDVILNTRSELFDSWYTPDFELPKWIHEHTKREVRERWSMDF